MRSLSTTAKNAIFASQTDKVFIVLLDITGGNLTETIRLTSDNVATTSNSNTYNPFPFMISMPPESADEIPVVQLTIDNIDRSIIDNIRASNEPLLIEMNIVLNSDPDTVEAGAFNYTLRNVTYDAYTITGDLVFEDILNEPYPAGTYDPVNYPGLFE